MDMLPREKPGKIPDQTEPSDWTPADIFDEAVGGFGVGCNHHLAAGEFTIVKRQEEAAAPINLRAAIDAQGKGPPVKPRQGHKEGK